MRVNRLDHRASASAGPILPGGTSRISAASTRFAGRELRSSLLNRTNSFSLVTSRSSARASAPVRCRCWQGLHHRPFQIAEARSSGAAAVLFRVAARFPAGDAVGLLLSVASVLGSRRSSRSTTRPYLHQRSPAHASGDRRQPSQKPCDFQIDHVMTDGSRSVVPHGTVLCLREWAIKTAARRAPLRQRRRAPPC